ncbi:tRNA-dihydrouridine synthase [Snodgrassella alvi]|uniref:tRNA-dihydrouridine synthase n=1 Tax=Snodgrassella alvi TaxID=1196083 RepID=UPI001553661B|nr:tRNA-dihydrouridine synthase [Snodgrassella alvi]
MKQITGILSAGATYCLAAWGSKRAVLVQAAIITAGYEYDEINLNCGCLSTSSRVQQGAFGMCLIREVELVAQCLMLCRNG